MAMETNESKIGTVYANIGGYSLAPLTKGGTPGVQITCTNAATNYAAGANIPAGTKIIEIYSPLYDVLVAIGEATVNGAASVGRWVPGALPFIFALSAADVAAGRAVNAQCATAGAVVQVTYLAG